MHFYCAQAEQNEAQKANKCSFFTTVYAFITLSSAISMVGTAIAR
jgi:hypothetical protein